MWGPWSGPSMFLSSAVFPFCLKKDYFTITFLIKACVPFLHGCSSSSLAALEMTSVFQTFCSVALLTGKVAEWCKHPAGGG